MLEKIYEAAPFAIFGLIGGIARGAVGITKALKKENANFKFEWKNFTSTTIQGAIVGFILGFTNNPSAWPVIVSGWVGTDLLDSIMTMTANQMTKGKKKK